MERILNVFNPRFSSVWKRYGDYIESARPVGGRGMGHKVARGPHDSATLLDTYGQLIAPVFIRLARLHFDKDDRSILRGDQIDLAREAAVIAGEDTIVPTAQMAGRGPFATDA